MENFNCFDFPTLRSLSLSLYNQDFSRNTLVYVFHPRAEGGLFSVMARAGK